MVGCSILKTFKIDRVFNCLGQANTKNSQISILRSKRKWQGHSAATTRQSSTLDAVTGISSSSAASTATFLALPTPISPFSLSQISLAMKPQISDKVAGAGFYVVAPDFFHGDPFSYENADMPLPIWIKDHGMDKGYEEAMPVIEALKKNRASKVGAAGFCWGAKVVVLLAQSDYIQAAVLLHPAFVSVDDFKSVKAPIAVLGAESDHLCPPELVKEFGEILNSKPEVESFTKIFPGVSHGWTVRNNTEDEAAVRSAEEAHQDMLSWFSKYIQ